MSVIWAGMKTLGIDVETFQKAVSNGDGAQAFAQAMQDIKNSTLDPLAKGKAMRDVFGGNFDDTMGQAAAGADQFTMALGHMDDAINGTGSSMKSSFDIMAKTTKSQLKIAGNALAEVGITIGSAMLPAINSVLHAITPLAHKLADFGRAHPGILAIGTAFAVVAAAIGPVLVAVGTLVSSIGKIGTAFGALKGIGAFSALKGAIAGIASVGAVPLLGIAAAGLAIWKFWTPLTTLFSGIAKGFSSTLGEMGIDASSILAPIRAAFPRISAALSGLFSQSDLDLSGLGEQIGSSLARLPQLVGQAFANFGSLSGTGKMFVALGVWRGRCYHRTLGV